MSLDKNAILIFTTCTASQINTSALPSLVKLKEKGTVLNNVTSENNFKALAGAGNIKGETIWEATTNAELVVGKLTEKFDLCVLDTPADINALEIEVTKALEVAERTTLIVLIAQDIIVYYGTAIAKGKVVNEKYGICTVAPTVAYIVNLPLPANCDASVCYAVLKDINFKMKEFLKLQTTIANMESAMERSSRQPWDKHDCA